jgi:hypothetical protein
MNTLITINPTVLTLVVSVLLPAAVALVTKRLAAGWVKALTLLGLAVVSGWAAELADSGGTFVLGRALGQVVVTFVVAVAVHYGFWKPVGLTGSAGVIARAVPGGIGPLRSPAA